MPRLDPAEATARIALDRSLATIDRATHGATPVVLAVSGGADSLAMAVATSFIAPRSGLEALCVVVDHGLQTDSAQVAQRAASQCRELGLDATVVRVDVRGPGGPEAAARAARYAALRSEAERIGARAICVAHTLDDQAETVLLGLGRGSGGRSLSGMPPVAGLLHRPFLRMRRVDMRRICQVHGLQPWDDPHNDDTTFRRVRVRHELLPAMEDVLGPGVADALARTAEQVATDTDLLDSMAAAWLAEHPGLRLAELDELHEALRTRVLRLAALAAGATAGELAAVHIRALDRMVTEPLTGRRVELPGSLTCTATRDRLIFGPTPVAR